MLLLISARGESAVDPMTLWALPPIYTRFIDQYSMTLLFLQEDVSSGRVPVNILRLPQHIFNQ